MISLKKLLYKMVEAINANHLPAATTTDKGKVLGIKTDGTYGLLALESGGAEVYTKNDFIILEGVIPNVPSRKGTGTAEWTAADLGVESLNDVAVLSVGQSIYDAIGSNPIPYRYECSYGTDMSGMVTYHNNYPMVFISANKLFLNVLNWSEATSDTNNIHYQLVLLKLR